MTNQTTKEVELELAEREQLVQAYEALQLLSDENTPAGKAFKTLVLDGYLKKRAIELTSLLSTEYTRRQGVRGNIMEELVAISAFEGYLHMIDQLGAPVEDEDEEEIDNSYGG